MASDRCYAVSSVLIAPIKQFDPGGLRVRPQAVWKDVSKHKRVAIFSVFAALLLLSSAFGGLGTITNVREHNGRVSITIGAPHEVRKYCLTHNRSSLMLRNTMTALHMFWFQSLQPYNRCYMLGFASRSTIPTLHERL